MGLTGEQEDAFNEGRSTVFAYWGKYFEAEAAYFTEKARGAIISEARLEYTAKAMHAMLNMKLFGSQMQSELARTMQTAGLDNETDLLEIGRDEMDAIEAGDFTLEQLIAQRRRGS